jgi:hypothetical protein
MNVENFCELYLTEFQKLRSVRISWLPLCRRWPRLPDIRS